MPATLAGMASTNGDWVVSLDEDGQHNPRDIFAMLDVAVERDAQLVYAKPTNQAAARPHSELLQRGGEMDLQEYVWATHISASSIVFVSFGAILPVAWQPIAAQTSISTWRSPGSWPQRALPGCCAASEGAFFVLAACARPPLLAAGIDIGHGSVAVGGIHWARVGILRGRSQRLLGPGQADRAYRSARLGVSGHCG